LATIYQLSPGYALSLKATELSNRGWSLRHPRTECKLLSSLKASI